MPIVSSPSPFQRMLVLPPDGVPTTQAVFSARAGLLAPTDGASIVQPSAPLMVAVEHSAGGVAYEELQLPEGDWVVLDISVSGGAIAAPGDEVEVGVGAVGSGVATSVFATFDLGTLTSVVGTVSRLTKFDNSSQLTSKGPSINPQTGEWGPRTGDQCVIVSWTGAVTNASTVLITLAQAA